MSFSSSLVNQLAREAKDKSVFEGLMENEKVLVASGFPPISPWWQKVLREFYLSNKQRLVVRAGRRAGKSSTLARVAVAEGLYGGHKVPPGDVGVFVFVSVRQKEAQERLRTIKKVLDALSVSYVARSDEVELRDKQLIFRVYPANFRTIVGMTCVGFVADECARWRDDELGANPATEVLNSLRPAMATIPTAREFLISSPWAQFDAHYEHFEQGNNEHQNVAQGTTWMCNPTLSPERCKQLAGHDESTFEREYKAIPMTNTSSQFFDAAAIDMAMDPKLRLPNYSQYGEYTTAGADFAFRSDWSAIVIAHKNGDTYRIGEIAIQKPTAGIPLKPSEVCSAFAAVCRRHGVRGVMADSHYRESVVEYLHKYATAFLDAPRKPADTFVRARSLMYQNLLILPKDDSLRRRLLEVQSRPTPSGGLSIILPRKKEGGHSDDISALVLALWQRKGKLKEEDTGIVEPEVNDRTRPNFIQKGWTRKELDELRAYEARRAKNRNNSYISGL